MRGYKDIPKELRREFQKENKSVFWLAIKAGFKIRTLYKQREELFALGEIKDNLHLPINHNYWLVDNAERVNNEDPTTPLDAISCFFGDANYRKLKGFDYETASKLGKFWAYVRWTLFRNSVWNWKIRKGLIFSEGFTIEKKLINEGTKLNGKPLPITKWRDQSHEGIQSVILKSKTTGKLYFRYSFTLPLSKLNPWRLLGFKFKNRMRGVGSYRIYKNRIWRKLTLI